MEALEITGSISKSGELKLDKPLGISVGQKVKVVILYTEEDELSEKENIYSLADGSLFNK